MGIDDFEFTQVSGSIDELLADDDFPPEFIAAAISFAARIQEAKRQGEYQKPNPDRLAELAKVLASYTD